MRHHIWALLSLSILWLLLARLLLLPLLSLLLSLLLLLHRVVEMRLHHRELVSWLHRRVLELVHEGWLIGWRWRCMLLTLRTRLRYVVELLVLLALQARRSHHASTTLEHVIRRVWSRLVAALPTERLLLLHLLTGANLLLVHSCRLERHSLAIHHALLWRLKLAT